MPGRERGLLERFAFTALTGQRRTRGWSPVFRFARLAFLVFLATLRMDPKRIRPEPGGRHGALVDVQGRLRG